jgi:hypothetical protein
MRQATKKDDDQDRGVEALATSPATGGKAHDF